MSVYDKEWDFEREQYVSSRKCNKALGPDAPHYPNKSERKLLTQMMQASGQSEEQVRSNKDNRQKLAKAAKAPRAKKIGGISRIELSIKRAKRTLAKQLGLPVWHPEVDKGPYRTK